MEEMVMVEESDVVARRIVKKDPSSGELRSSIRFGLVSEVHEESESSEDESDGESSDGGKLRSGEALVEWYPSGKESRVEEEKLVVLDRSLMLGELVTRVASDGKTIGMVTHINVHADFLLLPPSATSLILPDKDISTLGFANPFDASSNSSYVFYKDWVGALTEVRERLLLRADKGFKCWLNSSDTDDVKDLNCKNRRMGSSYDISQWYVGQELLVPYENLRQADWTAQFKPPERVRRAVASRSHGKLSFTVEKVKVVGLGVDWICWSLGDRAAADAPRPPQLLEGDDELRAVHRLDWFEYQTAQIGDRMSGQLSQADHAALIVKEEWDGRLVTLFDSLCRITQEEEPTGVNEKDDDDVNEYEEMGEAEEEEPAEEEKDGRADSKDQSSPGSSPDAYYTASESSTLMDTSAPEASPPAAAEPMETESAVASASTPKTSTKPSRKTARMSTSGGATLKATGKQHAKKRHRGEKVQRTTQPAQPSTGQDFVGEILLEQSKITVLWMNGTVEAGIPAAQLRYNQEDLDEHVFFAGSFVSPMSAPDGDTSTFGFVHSVDPAERIARVSWFSVDSLSDPEPKLKETESVSEMDLRHFQHFQLAPGTGVVRCVPLPPSDGAHALRNVGQVTGYGLTDGRVQVRWFSGLEEAVWPTTVLRAFDNYDADADNFWSEGDDYNSSDWTDVESGGSSSSSSENENEDEKEKEERKWRALTPEKKAQLATANKNLLLAFDLGRRELIRLRSRDCVIHRQRLGRSVLAWLRALHRLSRFLGSRYNILDHFEYDNLRGYRRSIRTWLTAAKQKEADSKKSGDTVEKKNEATPSSAASDAMSPTASVVVGRSQRNTATYIQALISESELVKETGSAKTPVEETEAWEMEKTNEFVRSCIESICGAEAVGESTSELALLELLMSQSQDAVYASFFDPFSKTSIASLDIMIFSLLHICNQMACDMLTHLEPTCDHPECQMQAPTEPPPPPAMESIEEEAIPPTTEEASPVAAEVPTDVLGEVESETTATSSQLEVQEKAPSGHQYLSEGFSPDGASRHFLAALRSELKLLRGSLPPGLFVKTWEDRVDLFSCLMVGPDDTPFQDSLFIFDVKLPPQYPNQPPLVHYRAYSLEQLNPNLYQNGKVCVSLLGTWSGKGSEKWNPGSSLLQVLVSIQGLILNDEPYFNEAGYESRKGAGPEFAEKSRRYNEMCVLRSVDQLVRLADAHPPAFAAEVAAHVIARGPALLRRLEGWMGLAGAPETPHFPLDPISAGFKLSAKRYHRDLAALLGKYN